MNKVWDVAVVGAGLAGLTCAQQLHQAGYQTVVLEKSRGLGGRLATRRLHNTCADHGLAYLEAQGDRSRQLIKHLAEQNLLHPWTEQIHELHSTQQLSLLSRGRRYVAAPGMTAVAKAMATSLTVQKQHRVTALTYSQSASHPLWKLSFDDGAISPLFAQAVVLAIPAPQALEILSPLSSSHPEFLDLLRSVVFAPCITVIASYESSAQFDEWQAIKICDRALAWINCDSSKREASAQTVFVLHSTAEFAQDFLEATDLQPAVEKLLARASQRLLPWLNQPVWCQGHRWRYAFPRQPLSDPCLVTKQPLPLICCGDWCEANQRQGAPSFEGHHLENALQSGLAAADAILS